MRGILDTSVVLARGVAELPGELAISAATLAELHFGVLVAADSAIRAERLRRLSLVERLFDALPIDDKVARSYGMLCAAVVERGHQPRVRATDLLVAATAHANDARLYTASPNDLYGLDGLLEIVKV